MLRIYQNMMLVTFGLNIHYLGCLYLGTAYNTQRGRGLTPRSVTLALQSTVINDNINN